MRRARFVLTMGIVLALTGCGRAKDVAGHAPRGDADSVGAVETTQDEIPAALRQPAIGARDSLMRTLRGSLGDWVQLWKAARPEFELDSLRFAGWADFLPAPDEQPWPVPDSLDADEQGLNALVVVAPGARRRLLIDRYQMISGGMIGGDPDSAPVLFDRGTGRTYTFESCGTPCGFHWAAWIDSVRFVLGGWNSVGAEQDRAFGTLTCYDLSRGLQATYLVPLVDSDEYARYVSAWQGWVLARLRRLSNRPRA